VRPEFGPVLLYYPQVVRLPFAGLHELSVVQIVAIPVLVVDIPAERLCNQNAPWLTQEGFGGEVGLPDQSLFVDGHIADRRQVIEVEIAFPRCLKFFPALSEFLVPRLQFNVIDPQFVEPLSSFFQRQGFKLFQ